MANTLTHDLLSAFRSADPEAVRDELAHVVNRAARLIARANRQELAEFWKTLSAVHYEAESLELPPELREQRGYLEAIVHLAKAVRDQSDDVEAIQKVKKCVHGPSIVAALRKEGTIRHGELAKRLGISASSLTQAMQTLADSQAITSTVHGKFKYYSLTPMGRLVAGKLEEGVSVRRSRRGARSVRSKVKQRSRASFSTKSRRDTRSSADSKAKAEDRANSPER
jgi:DNA-binding HxlR family transcriptional regulator